MPTSIDVFAKVRGHEREELLRAAREADLMPYFRTVESPAMPVVEMEGAAAHHARLQQLPRPDRRRARDAGSAATRWHRYGTGLTGSRLLNGTTPLHLELERELAEWMGTEDAIVFTTGHQANVGTLGTLLGPGDTVIVDSGDHASILDGVHPLAGARCAPSATTAWTSSSARSSAPAQDGGGVLVVVDGVFSMEGDVAPLVDIVELCRRFGARLMVDEAHGAGVLGARGAGTAELLGVEDAGRPAHGHLLQVAGRLRRLRGRTGRGDRVPAHLQPGLPVHRLGGARGARRRAGGAAHHPLPRGTAAAGRGARQRPLLRATACARSATGRWSPSRCAPARRDDGASRCVTPIVPVLVGDDWKAALLWRALYDAGVFTNCALHPAVPPGGRCCARA